MIYSHDFAPGSGGLTAFTDRLATTLVDLNVSVRMATASRDFGQVQRPWPIHWEVGSTELLRLSKWADVVHMNGFRATVVAAARLTRSPLIWTHHEYSFCPTGLGWWQGRDRSFALPQCWSCLADREYDRRSGMRRIMATWVRMSSRRLVSAHTTTTNYMKDRLNLPAATVIPLGLSSPFAGPSARSEIASDHREFVVIFAGRLIREKGVDVAIRAIADARRHGSNVRLDVIGEGPERLVLEGLARREFPDGGFAFLGAMEPDVVLAQMRLADAVIVPSVWSEPAGFVVLEAMAMGVPVVAADAGGIPEVARGTATLVARSDPGAFSRAVVELATDPARARTVATQGRRSQPRFPRWIWRPSTLGYTAG